MSAVRKTSFAANLFEYERLRLSEDLYQKFADRMYELTGVDLPLSPKNQALLRNRIVKVLRHHNIQSYEEYWDLLGQGDSSFTNEFIAALTTNMTSFFREPVHFALLDEILPRLLVRYPQELRFWCAAASTGQEAYSLAMTIQEVLPESYQRARILATDVNFKVLQKAAQGIYDIHEMQGLSPLKKQKHFTKEQRIGAEFWRANDELHRMIRFAPFNLIHTPYSFQYKFHVIFCRNVLIYFDEPTVKGVIDNLTCNLAPGGYLILGHSESGNIKHSHLKSLSHAVFQKV